ncbi:DUF3099 domain-containing protein [Microbacterium dextranolyticum]|nr:DUF3099 domain-containing protein [Microbacterium dextranolyticum]MBM7463129.1 putative membrane protein YdbT with pleckstrin-like domain [Microbacterium dextranolyticum]
MKTRSAQPATSLPRAPHDDAHTRMTKYFTMMSVRVVCFVLMVAVQPYSWYTWLFAVGAIVLPYLAVVIANVAAPPAARAIAPERQLASAASEVPPEAPLSASPGVIRISESPQSAEGER